MGIRQQPKGDAQVGTARVGAPTGATLKLGWVRVWRRLLTALVTTVLAVAFATVTTSCASGDDELTTAEMMEKLEGRPLTEAEVAERLALADFLCGFEGQVLEGVWDRLDADALEFQDWVFGTHCPERLSAYESARPETGAVPPTIEPTPTQPTTIRPGDLPATPFGAGSGAAEVTIPDQIGPGPPVGP